MQAVQKCFCYGPKECLFLLKKKNPQIQTNLFLHGRLHIYAHIYYMTFYLDMTLILYFETNLVNFKII